MPQPELTKRFQLFVAQSRFRGKGPLCVALVMTRTARENGLPLDPDTLLTNQGGQVKGLGKSAVQKILGDHGISRVLAHEGARTSRGSIANMRAYVEWLNSQSDLDSNSLVKIEKLWIAEVESFFSGKPFRLKYDTSKSTREVIRDILNQAFERQKKSGGTMYGGAVLQHLVGAKLDCALGSGHFEHHGFSTSDSQSGRDGDFLIGDVAIHVTTSPGEPVLSRCKDNIDSGKRPMIVTLANRLAALQQIAEDMGIADRVDFYDVEQFISLNLYEFSKFKPEHRKAALKDVIDRYNAIVSEHETDASLRIELL